MRITDWISRYLDRAALHVGRRLLDQGALTISGRGERRAEGSIVAGDRTYAVQAEIYTPELFALSCTCGGGSERSLCPHLAALLLAAEDEKSDLGEIPPGWRRPMSSGLTPPPDAEGRRFAEPEEVLSTLKDGLEHVPPPAIESTARATRGIEPARAVYLMAPDRRTGGLKLQVRVRRPGARGKAVRGELLNPDNLKELDVSERERIARLDALFEAEQPGALRYLAPAWNGPVLDDLVASESAWFEGLDGTLQGPISHAAGAPLALALVARTIRDENAVEDFDPYDDELDRLDGLEDLDGDNDSKETSGDASETTPAKPPAPDIEVKLQLFEPRSPTPINLEQAALIGHTHMIEEGRLHRVSVAGLEPWIDAFSIHGPFRTSPELLPRVLQRFAKLPRWPRLLAEPGIIEAPPVEPSPVIMLEDVPKPRGALSAKVAFRYQPAEEADPVLAEDPTAVIRDEQGRFLVRDHSFEDRVYRDLRRRLGVPRHEAALIVKANVLPGLASELLAKGYEVIDRGTTLESAAGLTLEVVTGRDWFGLRGGLSFGGGARADLPEVLAALARGDARVQLSDGRSGLLPPELVERAALLGLGQGADEELRFDRSQAWAVEALLGLAGEARRDEAFTGLAEKLATFEAPSAVPEPRGFTGRLRPYQREGLGWLLGLRELSLGGVLADDMGLGKTVQVLAHIAELHDRGELDRPALVVAPRSVLPNWEIEASRFVPQLKVARHWGPERASVEEETFSADLVVTTYGVLRSDAAELAARPFAVVILDEAQAIKNERSQVAKAARSLAADQRVALSGTPIENHLGELWSLFEYLNPGMLGRAKSFRDLVADGDGAPRRELSRALAPFVLRRRKEQVSPDLPPKTELPLWCPLEGRQKEIYEGLASSYRERLLVDGGLEGGTFNALEALLRLRQVALHPKLVDKATDASSAKLDALLPLLEEIRESEHKALVFSQFTSFLDLLAPELDTRGIPYTRIDGSTRDRAGAVERFQTDPDCTTFLLSLKAGGSGLNLTAGDYVFLCDPWWNPAVEAQAIDRAHRIGRERPVVAYRLIARGTVEEKVVALQEEKRKLAAAVLDATGDQPTLDRDTLAHLLG